MKPIYCLILGLLTALALTSCLQSSDNASSAQQGQSADSVYADVSAMTSVTLYPNFALEPLSDEARLAVATTAIVFTESTGEVSYTNSQQQTVSCVLPTATLNQIDAFWARAQICVSKYQAPSGENLPIACPAIAYLPFAVFDGPSGSVMISQSGMAATDCNNVVYTICDADDATDLASLAASVQSELSTLVCH